MEPAQSQNPIIIDLDSDSVEPPLRKMNKIDVPAIKNPYEFIEEIPQILLTM
jgi:hypothetical protein